MQAAAAAVLAAALQGCGSAGPEHTTDVPVPAKCQQFGPCDVCDDNECQECEFGYSLVDGICGWTADSGGVSIKAVAMENKGLTIDDTTFRYCADKIPMSWPATDKAVKSLRLFKSWESDWEADQKELSWSRIANFTKRQKAQVLVGTQITCSEDDDDKDWEDVKKLLKTLGKDQVMAVAVGNEMELLWAKDGISKKCIHDMWSGGYFWKKFKERVADLDSMGFSDTRLTTVMGGYVLESEPFVDNSKAKFNSWLVNATTDDDVKHRFVFSLNIYGYFDTSAQLDPGTTDQCNNQLAKNLCISNGAPVNCYFSNLVNIMRQRMAMLNPSVPDGGLLWIGETGWSTPASATLTKPMSDCPAWSAADNFNSYYYNFLTWDFNIQGAAPPDHVFYFTTRDSMNFGLQEGFGLIGGGDPTKYCDLVEAKIANASKWTTPVPPDPTPEPTPSPSPTPSPTPSPVPTPGDCVPDYGDCTHGETCCAGLVCSKQQAFYSQCTAPLDTLV